MFLHKLLIKKPLFKLKITICLVALLNACAQAKEIYMWREPTPIIKEGEYFSLIQDNGRLQKAVKGSSNMYLFSEKGIGVKPLILVGTPIEIIEYLNKNRTSGIENRITELPDIYMGVSPYKPQERFKGYFPLHDLLAKSIEQALQLVPAGTFITDAAGIPSDLKEMYRVIHSLNDEKQLSGEYLYVKFSYIEETGMKRIGRKSISFNDILQLIEQKGN